MKAGIVLDRWKLPIFTRHLKEAGFSYEEHGEAAADTLVLTVISDDFKKLKGVMDAAAAECKRAKA